MTVSPKSVTLMMGDGVPVVLGSEANGETVVWGTSCFDPSCEPVIWNNP